MNKIHKNIMPKEKQELAIEMFSNLDESYEKIIDEINNLAKQTVSNYIRQVERKQEQNNVDNRNSRTFSQIKEVEEKVEKILKGTGLKIYISGGSVPYLLLNQDSNRLHDDIDTVCRLEDMKKLREIFKQAGLYQEEWDSMTYATDGKDYGFEMNIDGVPFGIYPFSYEKEILTQYSYDPYNKQCKIKVIPLKELSDYIMTYESVDKKIYDTMSLEFIKMTKDFAKRQKDIVDSLKINETGLLRKDVLDRIEMPQEVQKTKASKLGSKTIQMTSKLESSIRELISTSLLSSKEAKEKYIREPIYQEYNKQIEEQQQLLLKKVQEMRKNNPNLSDEVFYKQMMVSFLSPVIQRVNEQYGAIIPKEKLQKLNGLLNPENINITFDKNKNDIQADSINGKLIINPKKTRGNTLEEKIVSSMGSSIHESFHLLVNMLKSPEQAEQLGERLMYKVRTSEGEKEVHFPPGKYGQVLNEGFVEKLSSEFSEQNGFYYTLNPSYISCTNLCSQMMQQDKTIDLIFLFTKSQDDMVNKMTPEVKSKFEEAERLFVLNKFEPKEAKKDEALKGIKSTCVISSWMERNGKVEEVKENETFKHLFIINRKKGFDQRSQIEIEIANMIREKNMIIKSEIEQYKNIEDKTITKSSLLTKGFANPLILILITILIVLVILIVIY